ncbi:MAG: helix-turn-helix domain-containing protein [Alphaproteobacteria bacterium]
MRKPRGHRTEEHMDIDRLVGARLRMRRTLLGMNQSRLGEAAGLTFQQVQKYENGANRISASKLHQFARFLGVPVSFFFEGVEPTPRGRRTPHQEIGRPHARETLLLVRAFARISDPVARESLKALIYALARRNN